MQFRTDRRCSTGHVNGEDSNELASTSVSRWRRCCGTGALRAPALAQNEQFIPMLVYRTGAYAPNGIPFANGLADYYKLVNARDGGINGVKIVFEECDTGYATDRGVECYERLKGKGPTGAAYFIPLSTGITFALTEKAPIDKIPIITMGYGRVGIARRLGIPVEFPAARHLLDGRRHHPAAHRQEGRRVRQAQGQEDRAGLSRLALTARSRSRSCRSARKMHGFEPLLLPVTHPGIEQKATWLQVRQNRPDYVILWGWGVMNSTAIKEAVAVGYPREKMYGVWWSGAEPDVRPAEDGAKGYNAVTLQHTSGQFKLHEDPQEVRLRQGPGHWPNGRRRAKSSMCAALIDAMLGVEAIRTAQEKFGKKPLTGEQVRWGLENLDLTAERIKELGFEGVLQPIKVSCADHEGARTARIQTWDGKNWKITSDWYMSDDNVIVPMVKEAAAKICGRKEDHARVSGDELMPGPVDPGRNPKGAAAVPPASSVSKARGAAIPILSVNNIEVVYDHVILVLKGVSLAVPRGEIVALLGANGAGKIHDAESDFQFAVGRARRGDQGVHRLRW